MTAELALLLPAVVLLVLVLLAVVSAGTTAMRVTDAARAAARAAAVGEEPGTVTAVARALAGAEAEVTVGREEGLVVVTVVRDLPGLLGVGDLSASGTARAVPEPGTP